MIMSPDSPKDPAKESKISTRHVKPTFNRMPAQHDDPSFIKDSAPEESPLPQLHGLVDDDYNWLMQCVESEDAEILKSLSKLEKFKLVRLVTKLKGDEKFSSAFFSHFEKLKSEEIDSYLQKLLTDSDMYRLQVDVRAVLEQMIKNDKQKTNEVVPGQRFIDLRGMEEGPEKSRIMRQVLEIMKTHYDNHSNTQVAFDQGCLYHISKTVKQLQERIDNSSLFLVMVGQFNGAGKEKVVGFIQFNKENRIAQIKDKIERPVKNRIEAVETYSAENLVLHEQLIATAVKFLEEKGYKGVGTALFNEALNIIINQYKKQVLTTEVQLYPDNNRSQEFHVKKGFKVIGYITEKDEDGNPIIFTLFAKGLTNNAIKEINSGTESAKPTQGNKSTPIAES